MKRFFDLMKSVRTVGVEPTRVSPRDPKSRAYANSATSAGMV